MSFHYTHITHTHMHSHPHSQKCVPICAWAHVYTQNSHMFLYICEHTYTHVCPYIHEHTYNHRYTHVHMHTLSHVSIYMWAFIYTCMYHTHMQGNIIKRIMDTWPVIRMGLSQWWSFPMAQSVLTDELDALVTGSAPWVMPSLFSASHQNPHVHQGPRF